MDTFNEILTRNPIVIDSGSGTIKAGLAGDDKPKLKFPSYVGRPKYNRVLFTNNYADYYLGNQQFAKGLLKIKYPMNHGIVEDFKEMDLIWKHVFQELGTSAKEYPVFLTEPPLSPLSHKIKLAEYYFKNYQTPALFFGVQGVLSLFANGKTTGVVLDSGDGVTYCVPIYDGYSISHATTRMDLGGRDITEYMMLLLRRLGYNFHTSAEFEIVKKIKENRCTLKELTKEQRTSDQTFNISQKDQQFNLNQKDPYVLPDGTTIDLTLDLKCEAAEILYKPDKIGLEYPSISQMLINTINKCDIDLRKNLYQEIVLAGGNTMIDYFPERLLSSVKKNVNQMVKVKIYGPPERDISCWVGASIISNLSSFKNMWITSKEYDEEGHRILLRKSF